MEMDLRGATVAVQGFGNVGSVSADLLSKLAAGSLPSPTGRAASTTKPTWTFRR